MYILYWCCANEIGYALTLTEVVSIAVKIEHDNGAQQNNYRPFVKSLS